MTTSSVLNAWRKKTRTPRAMICKPRYVSASGTSCLYVRSRGYEMSFHAPWFLSLLETSKEGYDAQVKIEKYRRSKNMLLVLHCTGPYHSCTQCSLSGPVAVT